MRTWIVTGVWIVALAGTGRAADDKPTTAEGALPKAALLLADAEPSPAAFAAEKLESALKRRGWQVRRQGEQPEDGLVLRLLTADAAGGRAPSLPGARPLGDLGAEAFAIRSVRQGEATSTWVIGGDAAGTMYGGLELAERIRAGADPMQPEDVDQAPRFALRAVKVNLPWISYRKHECLQLHDETCRDPAYWRALIDHLAECQFIGCGRGMDLIASARSALQRRPGTRAAPTRRWLAHGVKRSS